MLEGHEIRFAPTVHELHAGLRLNFIHAILDVLFLGIAVAAINHVRHDHLVAFFLPPFGLVENSSSTACIVVLAAGQVIGELDVKKVLVFGWIETGVFEVVALTLAAFFIIIVIVVIVIVIIIVII
jgi:hypothetical protein